jgi:hypothetical protein
VATIISHRGYWKRREERNAQPAFERSFASGFGIETDLRDDRGRLVISHDPPSGQELSLDSVLSLYSDHGCPGPLALNIKADGLQEMLAASIEAHQVSDWFAFDMSVPDGVDFAKHGMRFFTRQSEYEPTPALYEESAGVWVDSFERDWFDDATLCAHLDAGKRVCVVSPELHARDAEPAWRAWADWRAFASPDLIVCTDHPQKLKDKLPS